MTTATQKEKLYKRYDMQDESDFSIETLDEMRQWLADFWNNNPDDEMNDEEHEEMIEAILEADEKEIFERLSGIDYSYYELDENGEEIIDETTRMVSHLPFGYSVTSEKITIEGDKDYVMITLRRGKNNLSQSPFMVSFEKWHEEHEKNVALLNEELSNGVEVK